MNAEKMERKYLYTWIFFSKSRSEKCTAKQRETLVEPTENPPRVSTMKGLERILSLDDISNPDQCITISLSRNQKIVFCCGSTDIGHLLHGYNVSGVRAFNSRDHPL